MERNENWIPIKASTRATGKRTRRQGDLANREAKLFIIRYGHPSSGRCCSMAPAWFERINANATVLFQVKESIMTRVVALLTARTTTIPPAALPGAAVKGSSVLSAGQNNIEFPVTRAVALVCAAYAASVLDNALVRLGYDEREAAFSRSDDMLNEFTAWPLGSGSSSGSTRRAVASGGNGPSSKELISALVHAVKGEMVAGKEGDDLHFEVVVTVFEIFSRMDSLL